MAEHFYVDPKPQRMAAQIEGEELQPVEPEEPQEPADSDIDDEALAKHLGVPKSSMAASDGAEGSQESLTASVAEGSQDLHTGIAACAAEGSQDLHTGITASGAEGSPDCTLGSRTSSRTFLCKRRRRARSPSLSRSPRRQRFLCSRIPRQRKTRSSSKMLPSLLALRN